MADSARTDPEKDAADAGLTYVTDDEPGITRKKKGNGFTYAWSSGRKVTEKATRARIDALAIPPAWTDVWIAESPNAHLQATGRDDAGRKQYLYHEDYRKHRDSSKFRKVIRFARCLPVLRERVAEDLGKPGLPKEKVLALAVRLLDETGMRVGNDAYARAHESFGLTTLKDKHADVKSTRVAFHYVGKGGKEQEVDVKDRRLARLVKQCRDVPGQELFQYEGEDGKRHRITSGDVNAYIKKIAGGEEYSAKDFRTWHATVLAAEELDARDAPAGKDGAPPNGRARKREEKEAIQEVAEALGNTAAVTRASYVHPDVVEAFEDGELDLPRSNRKHYGPKEAAVLRFLEENGR